MIESDLYTLKLFGGVSLEGANGPVGGRTAQRRRLALLALLAASRGRGMSREKAIGYLWPDSDEAQARHLLSDSLYVINKSLGAEGILVCGNELRLNPEAFRSDLEDFEAALERGDLEQAISVYSGPFLDSFHLPDLQEFEHWADCERERVSRLHSKALEDLAVGCESQGDSRGAVVWWRRLAAQDPYSARIGVSLMKALDASGDRAAALQHARVYQTLVQTEFGEDPEPEVEALAAALRTKRTIEGVTLAANFPAVSDPGSTETSEAEVEAETAESEAPAPILETGIPQVRSGTNGIGDDRNQPGHPTTELAVGPAPHRSGPALWQHGFSGFLLLLVFASLALMWANWPTSSDGRADLAIAVVPFQDLSPQNAEYLSDGITFEIISTLGQVEGMRVASWTSTFVYRGRSATVQDIGRDLRVDAVLEGSIRRVGDQLRVTVNLIDVRSGFQIWSETYQRQVGDLIAVQAEISSAIVSALQAEFASQSLTGAGKDPGEL